MDTSWFWKTSNEDNSNQKYPPCVSITVLILTVFFVIIGTLGNTLTAIVFFNFKKLRRQPTTIFIMNLTITDLIISSISLPLMTIYIITRNNFLCKASIVVYYGNMNVSLFSLVAIAINRYILIVKPQIHNDIYTYRNTLIMIISSWILSYSLLLPMTFGIWGSIGFDKKILICEILKNDGEFANPKKIMIPIEFFLSCIVISFCYYCIYKKIKESRKKMSTYLPSQSTKTTTAAAVPNNKDSQETEVTKLMFKIFIGFLVCFLPTVLVNIFDSEGNYPVYHVVESMTSCACVVINPIIYVSTNKHYRSGFREIFSRSPDNGNTLTVIAFTKYKKLRRQPTTIFIMNLTIADLMISSISLPLMTVDLSLFNMTNNNTFCKAGIVLFYGNMSVSLFTLVAIAINRYILIVKPKIHNRIYTRRNTLIMMITIWIVSYALLLPMVFGIWGSVGLDKKLNICEILKNDGEFANPKQILIPTEFFISCIVIFFSYYFIYQKIKESRQKMSTYLPTQRAASNQEAEITFLMFKIFIGFLACFLPTVLVNIFDSDGNYPIYHLVESMTSSASVVINPIIYVSTNKLYRSAFRDIFTRSSNNGIATTQHYNNNLYKQAHLSSLPPTNSSTGNDTSSNPVPSPPSDS
ncbi:hypothetical protein HCN44_009016 [Aphidius gifuensis]|uniref:G-protein coupled receptors family 1 profile domain-containing protein n=1 Tax=Aphidius gifuensis TaxID=684658 RepID=A0A834XML8_APHGI|nr:hypothetical protein HCN44_009016 [Aphidius gifuensis]